MANVSQSTARNSGGMTVGWDAAGSTRRGVADGDLPGAGFGLAMMIGRWKRSADQLVPLEEALVDGAWARFVHVKVAKGRAFWALCSADARSAA